MSLDVFSPAASDQNVMANAAPDLPADFGEAFDVAWRSGTEFHNSAAYSIAQHNALSEYVDGIKQKTGEQLPLLGAHSEGNELNDFVTLDDFNAAQAKVKEKYPGLDYLTPLSDGDLNAMTLQRMKRAHDDATAFQSRETTWGGTAGGLLGTMSAGLTDPVMVATLPLGGAGELGIAARALEFAAITGGTTAVSAGLAAGSREAAVPGSSKEIPGEIAGSMLFGAGLGGAFGVLGKLLGHGAKPLPTSVRDEVNAATSEFQFQATNPFPSAAGEAAARDATVDATTALVRGEPVRSADGFDAAHVADYALAAKADSPEALALAGEQHLRPETFADVPDVERFDRMPSETDDAASYWDKRLEAATPEERQALGASDNGPALVVARQMPDGTVKTGQPGDVHSDLMTAKELRADGPTPPEIANAMGFATSDGKFLTRQEALDFAQKNEPHRAAYSAQGEHGLEAAAYNEALPASAIAPRDLTPEQVTKLAADPATDSAVLHNLDHIIAEKPDAEFITQVRMPDGSYQLQTQKLSDVLAELDGLEAAGKELEACAAGLALAAE